MKRGEIRWSTLRPPDKRRPVLILTRTSALAVLTGITVAPITTTNRNVPTYILLTPAEDKMPSLCSVNLDNIQTIQKTQIDALITTLSEARMKEVESALCFALGIDAFFG